MKVLLKKVGQPYRFAVIANKLRPMQECVGGNIEVVRLPGDMVLVCNEEGLIKDLPKNATILTAYDTNETIRGDFFVCKSSGEEFTGFDVFSTELNIAQKFHVNVNNNFFI